MANKMEEYLDKIDKRTDAPDTFKKASAYHLFSNLLGRFYTIISEPATKPNLWFLLSSIPGRYRRSTLQRYNYTTLKSAEKNYRVERAKVSKARKNVSPEEAEQLAQNILIEEGSTEGLIDKLMQTDSKIFSIASHEFGGVIRKLKSNRYSNDMDTFLSKLYYGQPYSGSFVDHDRFIPPGYYVTMLAGMQEPERYLDEGVIRQGLLRRIFVCYVEPKKEHSDNWKPPIPKDPKPKRVKKKKFEDFGEDLADTMLETEKVNKKGKTGLGIEIRIRDSPREKINDLAFELENSSELLEQTTNTALYKQSLWEILTKMSAVRAIARVGVPEQPKIDVIQEDYEKARGLFERLLEDFEKVLPDLGVKKEGIYSKEELYERIVKFVSEDGGVIPAGKLENKLNKSKRELFPHMETLIEGRRLRFALFEGVRAREGKMHLFFNDMDALREKAEEIGAKPIEEVKDSEENNPKRYIIIPNDKDLSHLKDLWGIR